MSVHDDRFISILVNVKKFLGKTMMKRLSFSCLRFIFVGLFTAMSAFGQTDIPELKLGQSLQKVISGSDIHSYNVAVEANLFMFGVVDQQGIDVVVRIYDPNGKQIEEIDSPNGRFGPEPVSLVADASGFYRIDVTPLNSDAEPGNYEIRIIRIQPCATTIEGKVDQLFTIWDRPDSPGASLAVVRDGHIVYKHGYGCAQLEYGVPITPSTIFHVASVSKQFTAFAVTMLAHQGHLCLDDDIRKYIPELADFGHTITIRHLIHHTSGLRDQWNLLAMAGWRLDDVITKEHILTLIAHQKELNFNPGDEMVYCNTGYTLLAEIVARVTERSFPEWTAENIFKPLGMTHTHFHADHELIVPNRAYSYNTREGGGFRKSVLSYANVGATSLFTTVEDLAKWALNFEDGTVGGKDIIEQMEERAVLNSGDTLGYAFGQGIGTYHGLRTVAHSGGDAGFRTFLVRFPDQKFSVAILSNLGGFNPSGMAYRVADLFLADLLVPDESQEEPSEATEKTVTVDSALLDDYTGTFQFDPWRLLTVAREDDHLTIRDGNGPSRRMIALSDTAFNTEPNGIRIIFQRDEKGNITKLTYRERAATRVEAFTPSHDEMLDYVGDYVSEELGTTYSVVVENDQLMTQHRRHGDGNMTPTVRDHFTNEQWWMRNMRFIRDENDRIMGLRVSNGRVRNLRFEKIRP